MSTRLGTLKGGVLVLLSTLCVAPRVLTGEAQEKLGGEPVLRLADLERMALDNNPTIAQAAAGIRAAEGRTLQAGLYPNPIMGYIGAEISGRAPTKTSEHLFFMEQAIVTAGKLKHNRSIFAQARSEAEAEAEAQRLRVLNAVRLFYYAALGAQEMVTLRENLAEIARTAAATSEQLFNVGAADRPDLLESQIELHQSEIDLMEAENDRDRVWQMLAAVVGNPWLEPASLEGNLEAEIPRFDRESTLATLLADSPELRKAQVGVERARATLRLEKAEPVPDVLLRGGVGYNFEELDALGGRVGLEAFIEVGFQVPLFNRNQGNIAAAQAEIDQAERDVTRLDLALHARLAMAFDRYLDSLGLTERYQTEVLPRAQEAYDLYLARFQQMAAAYPQVLISQRTLFQVRVQYIEALVELWQNAVLIRGMLLAGGLEPPEPSQPGPGRAR